MPLFRGPHRSDEKRPRGYRLGFAAGVTAVLTGLISIAYLVALFVNWRLGDPGSPEIHGAPLRIAVAGSDAVFLMSSQWETRITGGSHRWRVDRGTEKVLHVDLWRFDAATMQPAWRRRLLTERHGVRSQLALLGADGDRLWLFVRQPIVVSATDGGVMGNAERIEARNPPLAGVLPRDSGFYKFFAGHGLVLTSADARAWRIDAATLEAKPWLPQSSKPRDSLVAPPYFVPMSTSSFQKRGMQLPNDWLGVLTDAEAAKFAAKPVIPGRRPDERPGAMQEVLESQHYPTDLDHSGPNRFRVWRAKVEQVSAAPAGWSKDLPDDWGTRPKYSDYKALPESPEFLRAGLLSDGRSKLPIWLRSPDSVLILHRDRIDDEGRLFLARIVGPDGRVAWNAGLGLSILQAVAPGPDTIVLYGREYPSAPDLHGNPYNDAHEKLVSVATGSGNVRVFDITGADRANGPRTERPPGAQPR